MTRGAVDAFKRDLEDEFGFYASHGSETFDGVLFYPAVYFADLFVGESAVGFGERHKLFAIPYGEGIVRVEVGAPAMAAHGVDHDGVDGEGIDLPFPPVAAAAPVPVDGILALQHDSLTEEFP